MFAIMYNTEDGKEIKICKTQDEAIIQANKISRMGYQVTVFDYDSDSNTYIEFYTI